MNYTLILIMFTSKVFSFYFRSVARDTIHSCLQLPRLYAVLGTFSTDGFQDGYGELDRAGLGIQGAVRTKARENKNSLATKTIPDYGVNEIVGETRTQT